MIGDTVGGAGLRMLNGHLKRLRREQNLDAVIVNGENVAAGSGITAALAKKIFAAGADAITLGDHTWGQKEFPGEIARVEGLVRPANSSASRRGLCRRP